MGCEEAEHRTAIARKRKRELLWAITVIEGWIVKAKKEAATFLSISTSPFFYSLIVKRDLDFRDSFTLIVKEQIKDLHSVR